MDVVVSVLVKNCQAIESDHEPRVFRRKKVFLNRQHTPTEAIRSGIHLPVAIYLRHFVQHRQEVIAHVSSLRALDNVIDLPLRLVRISSINRSLSRTGRPNPLAQLRCTCLCRCRDYGDENDGHHDAVVGKNAEARVVESVRLSPHWLTPSKERRGTFYTIRICNGTYIRWFLLIITPFGREFTYWLLITCPHLA